MKRADYNAQIGARNRERVARHFLEHPTLNANKTAAALGLCNTGISLYVSETTPAAFLKQWGGDLATDERISAVLKGGLRIQHEHAENRRRSQEKPKKTETARTHEVPKQYEKYLSAGECQWLTDGVWCRKAVTGLYCAEHSGVARCEEEKRIAASRTA